MIKIECLSSSPLPGGIPDEIVYLPEGEHTISPFVNGKPKTITINIPRQDGHAIAASLQASLEERQRRNVRPWIDFEHKGGVAAALPQSFRYEDGQGIMLHVDWTGTGRTAIQGRDFSYFSPTFMVGKDGTPAGLPPVGPIGALVNEPAFREIQRIAASDSGDDPQSKIEAALDLARELNPDTDFPTIWEAARELSPAAFE